MGPGGTGGKETGLAFRGPSLVSSSAWAHGLSQPQKGKRGAMSLMAGASCTVISIVSGLVCNGTISTANNRWIGAAVFIRVASSFASILKGAAKWEEAARNGARIFQATPVTMRSLM